MTEPNDTVDNTPEDDSASDDCPWIIHATDETFEEQVLTRSQETPVVIDFWATWCQPCLMLAPVLEKVAREYEGKFILVKAESSEAQNAAAQFNVQSLPTVMAVCDGELVDFFSGVVPEEQFRDWIDRVLQVGRLAEAKRLEEVSPEAAEAIYRSLHEQLPNEGEIQVGIARVLFAQDRIDDCREYLEQMERRGFLEPEAEKIKSAIHLKEPPGEAVDLAELRKAAEDADNFPAQLALAEGLAAAQEFEEALEIGLSLVAKDRKGAGEQARQMMVDIFHVLPDDSEMLHNYRRRLSLTLY